MKAKVITLANQKGGVAKTTTAVNLAYYLNHYAGKNILLVDADPQCNATKAYRGKYFGEATLYDLLFPVVPIGKEDVTETIQHTEFGDLLPSDKLLTNSDDMLHDRSDRYLALKQVLETVDNYTSYDYIIIDTNPSLNTLLQCAIAASDFIVMPCEPDLDSLEGLSDLSATIVSSKKERNRSLLGAGILIAKMPPSGNVYREIADQAPAIAKKMAVSCFTTRIRQAAAVGEAKVGRMPLLAYKANSKPSLDYIEFGKEFLALFEGEKNNGKER